VRRNERPPALNPEPRKHFGRKPSSNCWSASRVSENLHKKDIWQHGRLVKRYQQSLFLLFPGAFAPFSGDEVRHFAPGPRARTSAMLSKNAAEVLGEAIATPSPMMHARRLMNRKANFATVLCWTSRAAK
jgi:hypothetical protein